MNRLSLVLSVALLAGCSANPGPLFVDGIALYDTNCVMPKGAPTAFSPRGVIDLASWTGGTGQLLRILQVSGWDQVAGPTQLNNSQNLGTLEGTQRRFVLDQMHLSYKTSKGSPLGVKVKASCPPATGGDGNFIDCDVVSIFGAGQTTGSLLLGEDLIGTNMRARLVDLANTNTTLDPFTLYVTIELTGRQVTVDKPLTTGPIVYPVTVYKKACAASALVDVDNMCAKACP